MLALNRPVLTKKSTDWRDTSKKRYQRTGGNPEAPFIEGISVCRDRTRTPRARPAERRG